MNLPGFILRKARVDSFRTGIVALASAALSSLGVASFLILLGSRTSLQNAVERVGADIIVVPHGTMRQVETALLMGIATEVVMPASVLDRVRSIPGVVRASPQLHLSTLKAASCCSQSQMFVIAYDPSTDFTLRPWLDAQVPGGLQRGEALGGRHVFEPPEGLTVYGTRLKFRANLAATGTGLDQSMFVTFETAYEIARRSVELAVSPLRISPDTISAVLLRVDPSFSLSNTAARIEAEIPRVSAIASPRLFESYREQLHTLNLLLTVATVSSLLVAILVMVLVFGIATHEKRREIGVIRALGATRLLAFSVVSLEALGLGTVGSAAGCTLTIPAFFLFHRALVFALGIPIALPSSGAVVAGIAFAMGISVIGALVASFVIAVRTCRLEPASAMREAA